MKKIVLLASCFLAFSVGKSQLLLSQFTWDTDPGTNEFIAETGPDATNSGMGATQMAPSQSGKGLAPGYFFGAQNINLSIPGTGGIFNENELTVSIDYRRNASDPEVAAWFFQRGLFRFGMENGRLVVGIPYNDGSPQYIAPQCWLWVAADYASATNDFASREIPADGIWRNYRLEYDMAAGQAKVYIDGVHRGGSATKNTSPGAPLDWSSVGVNDPFIIGPNADNEGIVEAIFDNAMIFGPEPLPITLTSFEGEQVGNANLLTWETANEMNNDYFTLERSLDGQNYEVVGLVDGMGNSTSAVSYEFLDEAPNYGSNFYRLSQTDFNGKTTHSSVIEIFYALEGFGLISVFPNPVGAGNQVSIVYKSDKSYTAQMTVSDITGRIVSDQRVQVNEGMNKFALESDRLGKGMFFIRLNVDGQIYQHKLISTQR